jgi:hypothetical protein
VKKVNEFLIYAVMLESLIVNIDTARDNAGRIKVFVCVSRLPQLYLNEPYQKLWMFLIFFALEINKYMSYINVCISYRKVYILYIHTLQVNMSTSGMVIHYIGWGRQTYIVLNWNFVFDLGDFDLPDIFQEHNPGLKQELPVCFYLNANYPPPPPKLFPMSL